MNNLEDIDSVEFYGLKLTIRKEDGQFENEAKEKIDMPRGIKLDTGKFAIKVTAHQLAGLRAALQEPKIKLALQVFWLEEEVEYQKVRGGFE